MQLFLVSQLLGLNNKRHNRFQIICLFVTNLFSTGTLDTDCSADANVCAGDGEVCDTGNTDVCICDASSNYVNNGNNKCVCDAANNYIADESGTCVCDAASHYIDDSGTCVCDAANNYIADGGSCKISRFKKRKT